MTSYSLLAQQAIRDVQQTRLPRSLLRGLVRELRIAPGSRLLIAGEGTAPLTSFFFGIGIDVADFDGPLQRKETTPVIHRERSRASLLPDAVRFPEQSFDAALVTDCAAYRRSLFDLPALRATANLLGTICSSGRLVFLGSESDESLDATGHSHACVERHLELFDGDVRSRRHPARLRRLFQTFESSPDRQRRFTCTLSLPSVPRLRRGWTACVERAVASSMAPCCATAAQRAESGLPEAA